MADAPDGTFQFRPKFVECLKGYTKLDLFADISAGTTVGVVALSLAMSLGIASLPPDNRMARAIGNVQLQSTDANVSLGARVQKHWTSTTKPQTGEACGGV